MYQNANAELFLLHNIRAANLAATQFDLTFDVSDGLRRDANEFNADADAREAIAHFTARLDLSPSEREEKSEVQNGAFWKIR